MESLGLEIEVYLSRPCEDWRDHQRVLPWGHPRPTPQTIAGKLGVDISTVYKWQRATCPLPVELAFHIARHCGTQYLSYLAHKNNLTLEPIRTITLKGPLMDSFAQLQSEQSKILPLLAKIDRGETLTPEEEHAIHCWRSKSIELTSTIAAAATKGTPRD